MIAEVFGAVSDDKGIISVALATTEPTGVKNETEKRETGPCMPVQAIVNQVVSVHELQSIALWLARKHG